MGAKVKLVLGVGVNDAGYTVSTKSKRVDGKQKVLWVCPFYRVWVSMLTRCYSQRFQTKQPAYIGCTVCDEWLLFSAFMRWMSSQDWRGKALDKDILLPGNKTYSPEICIFVSQPLNNFLIGYNPIEGRETIGCTWMEKNNKYMAQCKNPFTRKNDHLGLFADSIDAHLAWKAKKHEHACRYADLQTDPRIAIALRTRYLPEKEII